jgi:hypothetical protein
LPVVYTNNVNAGTATATATYVESANHLGSSHTQTFVINKATAVIELTNLVRAWTGSALDPTAVTTPLGLQTVGFAYSQGGVPVTQAIAVGVYNVQATLDNPNYVGSTTALFVIYDPSGGFVTGGGWILSPEGACLLTTACAGETGRANFGFVSKYQKGKNDTAELTGQTQFQFQAGNLNFHSTAYEWLVISGARAQYKGTGTINGAGVYEFMLTGIDGQVNGGGGYDRFRIKITQDGVVVYDNQTGTDDTAQLNHPGTLVQGSVVIHEAKGK